MMLRTPMRMRAEGEGPEKYSSMQSINSPSPSINQMASLQQPPPPPHGTDDSDHSDVELPRFS
jgi:hypothetical protein